MITREQFDERLDIANTRLRAERQAIEAQNAELKQLTARYEAALAELQNRMASSPDTTPAPTLDLRRSLLELAQRSVALAASL